MDNEFKPEPLFCGECKMEERCACTQEACKYPEGRKYGVEKYRPKLINKLKWQQGIPKTLGWCWIRHGDSDIGMPYIMKLDKHSDEITGNCSVDELYWAGPIWEPED